MSILAKKIYYMEDMRERARRPAGKYYSLTIEITHAGHTIRLASQWEEESKTWKKYEGANTFFVVRGGAPMSEWHDILSSQGKWVIGLGTKYTITSTVNNGKDPYTTQPPIIDDVRFSDVIGRDRDVIGHFGYQIYFDTDPDIGFYFNQPGWSRRR